MCDDISIYNSAQNDVAASIEHYNGTVLRKLYIDDWLVRCDKWLTRVCKQMQRKINGPSDFWCDLKSELTLFAYEVVEKWDGSIPIDAFLFQQLRYIASWRKVIRRVYHGNYLCAPNSKKSGTAQNIDSDAVFAQLVDENCAISSQERQNVLNSVEKLSSYDQTMILLHLTMGMTFPQIDQVLGASRGCAYHRYQTIMKRLRDVHHANE